ncbi:hypothetical protein [Myroides odoratus]|uniref:hypothetical protein n=1 Tax=Myroides odoratus TaxID=256 RepID=UPI000766111E|nr:hypothetical protein [Myroides odoratus]
MADSSEKAKIGENTIEESYFVNFYKKGLNKYLPPRYKDKSIDELAEIDLEKALDKWWKDTIIDESKYENLKNDKLLHSHIVDCVKTITELQLKKIKLKPLVVSNRKYEIIKNRLVRFFDQYCIALLYFIKNYDSIESRNEMIKRTGNNIFVNSGTCHWFIQTIDSRFNIKKGDTYGLNAFVNALINNDEVKNHILLKSFTQKKVVEYINLFYGEDVIKYKSKLSNPKSYIIEVNELIKEYLRTKKR